MINRRLNKKNKSVKMSSSEKDKRYNLNLLRLILPEKFDNDLIGSHYGAYRPYIKQTTINMLDIHETSHFLENSPYGLTCWSSYIDLLKRQSKKLKMVYSQPRLILSLYYYIDNSDIVDSYLSRNFEDCLKFLDQRYKNTKEKGHYFPLFFELCDLIETTDIEELLNVNDKEALQTIDFIKYAIINKECPRCPYVRNYHRFLRIGNKFKEEIIFKALELHIKNIEDSMKMFNYNKDYLLLFRYKSDTTDLPVNTNCFIDDNKIVLQNPTILKIDPPKNNDNTSTFNIFIVNGYTHILAIFLLNKDIKEVLLLNGTKFKLIKKPKFGRLKDFDTSELIDDKQLKVNDSITYDCSILINLS